MSGRPEALFPLFAALDSLVGVGPKAVEYFAHLGVFKPRDLLFLLPHSVIDRRPVSSVMERPLPDVVTVEVTVISHLPSRSRGRPHRISVEDAAGEFQLVFFHAKGDYLERILPVGARRIVSGRVELFDGVPQMAHPDHILAPSDAHTLPAFEPVYPLTAGLTQKVVAKAALGAMTRIPKMPEWIDASLVEAQQWPPLDEALIEAHDPSDMASVTPNAPARMRLAYDELFAHQLTLAIARASQRAVPGIETLGDGGLRQIVLDALPYKPTNAQTRATAEIVGDLERPVRMNRLLQGDVGSGKTLVALMALLAAVEAGGQAVMMAPTEILARQHLTSLHPLAKIAGVEIDVLTGRDKGEVRAQKLAALADGRLQILLGTHAVFQADVLFKDLRLAIIDEQHRFGVRQRLELGDKGRAVDVLVMTATPIPRSLSLAQYGDMDVSVLDEKPPGRTPVKTALSSVARMDEVIEHLKGAIKEDRQAYWVCPLVEESEVSDLTSAEGRFKSLRAALGDENVGLVHGQMPTADKDAAMAQFVAGKTSVLVATTVIEVGVNVPNASIMVIERAETFGLAQLHQLRGRVGRGDAASTCLLMFDAPLSETGKRRLQILRDTEDGFVIAEEDLLMRGAGDVIGTAQSGLPRFLVADLEKQAGLMAKAQKDARLLLNRDPKLTSPRGEAARQLLWLMEQEKSIRLISVG